MSTDAPAPNGLPPGQIDWSRPTRFALIACIAGFALYAIVGVVNLGIDSEYGMTSFISAFLAGWVFWVSFPIGATALLMVHYLAKTSWGVLLKRSFEACMRTFPLMIVLFIPLAAAALLQGGDHPLYWWTSPETVEDQHAEAPPPVEGDAQLQAYGEKLAQRREASNKQVEHFVKEEREDHEKGNLHFLSPVAYVILSVVYFCIWGVFAFFFLKWAQDMEDDPNKVESRLEKLKNISGPGLVIHAIVLTAAASHWIMSLQPGWASTMFPVIVLIHQFLATLCLSVMVFLYLSNRSPFREVMRPKFQLDMGSMMLAFTLFWSYTSFSQLMLIWIGNLPEEIPFYLKRSGKDGWWWVSAALILFHFACPFLLLLFRDIKLHPVRLRIMAMYLLAICAVDVVWWVEPSFPHHSPVFILMDIGAIAGIGGLFWLVYLNKLKSRPLLPKNELFWLPEGHHEQH